MNLKKKYEMSKGLTSFFMALIALLLFIIGPASAILALVYGWCYTGSGILLAYVFFWLWQDAYKHIGGQL